MSICNYDIFSQAVFQYGLFALVVLCLLQEILRPVSMSDLRQVELAHPLAAHHSWLEHLCRARGQRTLGPLRLENRRGLCVVGMGQRWHILSAVEGLALIRGIKEQISSLFDPPPVRCFVDWHVRPARI